MMRYHIKKTNVFSRNIDSNIEVDFYTQLIEKYETENINLWQSLLDNTSSVLKVPTSLIMKLNQSDLEVFVSSSNKENIVEKGMKDNLLSGLYCENVIGEDKMLNISNSQINTIWKNNPHAKSGLISYLGFPLKWPNDVFFGTICVLNNTETDYNDFYIEYVKNIQNIINRDLKIIIENEKIINFNKKLENENLKNYKLIKFLSHDIKDNLGSTIQLLDFKNDNSLNLDNIQSNEVLSLVKDSTLKAFNILESILHWSNTTYTDKVLMDRFLLKEIILSELNNLNISINVKKIAIELNICNKCIIKNNKFYLSIGFRNILSNAIKFSKKGSIISIRSFVENNNMHVSIKDQGIGMTKKQVDELFLVKDIYDNLDFNSTQVGMLMVKDFFDKINVTIKVNSKINEGTEFIISIPLNK